MGKNSKGNNRNGQQNKRSSGDWLSALSSVSEELGGGKIEKKEEPAENKYKNYDPARDRRKNGGNGGGQSGWNGNRGNDRNGNQRGQNGGGSRIPNAQVLPLNDAPYSPYNFVPFSDKVFEDSADNSLNLISDSLFSGELCYELSAQTPILVDSGKDLFYRDKDGEYALPGSTMRGLIRSNLQILSFSSARDDIDDYNLMYRAVAGGALKNPYADVLGQKPKVINNHRMTVLENVKAGYLRRSGDKYILFRNKQDSAASNSGGTDYYVVSERYVIEKAQDKFECILGKMNYKPGTKFKKIESGSRVRYVGTRGRADYNENYEPRYEEITYSVGDNDRVTGIKKNGLKNKGYVLFTGKMDEKKAFYVIPEIDEDSVVGTGANDELMKDAVRAFQIDYNRRKNGLKDKKGNFIKFFDLPDDGETRPVFYIELDGRLYFGYTPRLRLIYAHKILDGLGQKESVSDFSKKMFGYSLQNGDSHKSRLFFTDAVITNKANELEPQKLILAEPKPTSYLEYVCQENGKPVKTFNDDSFRLRGTKQYWLQDKVNRGADSDKENVKSSIRPLKEGCKFKGKIRFQNLTAEELGLLIWSVKLEKNSQMNLGKAKAYGYGRVKVDQVELYLQDYASAYKTGLEGLSEVQMKKSSDEDRDAFVEKYETSLANWLGVKVEALLDNPVLSDFFYMKSYIAPVGDPRTSYMPLEKNSAPKNFSKFKQDNNPLPTVRDFRKKDGK